MLDENDGRPEDGRCWNAGATLPCYRDGFKEANPEEPAAGEEGLHLQRTKSTIASIPIIPNMRQTRREYLLRTGTLVTAVGLAGCGSIGSGGGTGTTPGDDRAVTSDNPGTEGSGPVYNAASEFEAFLKEQGTAIAYEAEENPIVEVEKQGSHDFKVTTGAKNFINDEYGVLDGYGNRYQSLCIALEESSGRRDQILKRAFYPGAGPGTGAFWLGDFAHEMYTYFGPFNAAYREDGKDAITTYAFRFTDRDTTVSFEASGRQMANWSEKPSEEGKPELRLHEFEDTFINEASVVCQNLEREQTQTPTDEKTGECTAPVVQTESVKGYDLSNEGVGQVRVIFHPSPGCTEIDVSKMAVQWVGPNTVTTVAPETPPSDGRAVINSQADNDDSFPILNATDDRAMLKMYLDQLGGPLPAGSEATIKLQGVRINKIIQITVPSPLPSEQPVSLAYQPGQPPKG